MPNHTTRLHFSPDSKQLVVGLSDCSLNLWDVDSMAHLSIATEKKGLFIDAAFISNTAELAYCVAGTTTTHIMNAVSGECEKTMTELAGISIHTHTHSLTHSPCMVSLDNAHLTAAASYQLYISGFACVPYHTSQSQHPLSPYLQLRAIHSKRLRQKKSDRSAPAKPNADKAVVERPAVEEEEEEGKPTVVIETHCHLLYCQLHR